MKVTKEQLQALVAVEVKKRLNEAKDDRPTEPWVKFGNKVDDFINDTVEKCEKLMKEADDIIFGEDDNNDSKNDSTQSNRHKYMSSRVGFLKNLSYKLAQKYEALRREN